MTVLTYEPWAQKVRLELLASAGAQVCLMAAREDGGAKWWSMTGEQPSRTLTMPTTATQMSRISCCGLSPDH